MFSVIIPTMWRSMRVLGMLHRLYKSEYVDEIIIIDNDKESRLFFDNKKTKILEQEENIFVNPAWNLGVKEAKNENICILNDDVTFDVDIAFSEAESFLFSNGDSCLGLHPNSFRHIDPNTAKITDGHFIGLGWGCCIFMKKSVWVDIPEGLKTWFGDNWIASHCRSCASLSVPVSTEMSTTNNSISNIKEIQENDMKTWRELTST